jgi:hypothetical protein
VKNQDPDHISESLETIFWVQILKFFDADANPGSENLFDPGSAMEKIRIRNTDHMLMLSTASFPSDSPPPFLNQRGFIFKIPN